MSDQRLNLVPTDKLIRSMIALDGNEDFAALMAAMKDRSEGLALWASAIEKKTKLRWAQGRVSEMQEWLYLWHNRRAIKHQMELQATVKEVVW